MSGVASILDAALNLYSLILIGRLVFEYIRMFARDWRPAGVVLLLAEFLYSVTDPPLRVLRRVLPPLRIGTMYLDLSYLVLFLGIYVARMILAGL
jgi:YggT family protein